MGVSDDPRSYASLLIGVLRTNARAARAPTLAQEPRVFRNVLAFENFILLMAVVFGLQIVDRSFGPILPLYWRNWALRVERVPLVSGLIFSIAAAGAVGQQLCTRLLLRPDSRARSSLAAAAPAAPARWCSWCRRAPRGCSWPRRSFGIALGTATTTTYTPPSA